MVDAKKLKVAILGAGITGLSLSWYLEKYSSEPIEVTIFEKGLRVGGLLHTDTSSSTPFEVGPHTLRLSDPLKQICLELIEDLSLSDRMVYSALSAKKRYIGTGKKLYSMPPHPLKLLHPTPFKNIITPLLLERFKSHNYPDDLSIYDFFSKRYSSYIANQFIDPLVSGIFGGDCRSLSLKSCFPELDRCKNDKKSLFLAFLKFKQKSSSQIISFKKGLSELPNRMRQKMNAKICLDAKVTALDLRSKCALIANKETFEFDHIFSSLPAKALCPLLKENSLNSYSFLENLPFTSFKVIHLGFAESYSKAQGFGFLTPTWNHEKLTGVIFDSSIFPEQLHVPFKTKLTVLVHKRSSIYALNDSDLVKEILRELRNFLNISKRPLYQKVFHLQEAIPQYEVGYGVQLKKFREEIKEKLPSFSCIGNSFDGYSIPQCIASGRKEALNFLNKRTKQLVD